MIRTAGASGNLAQDAVAAALAYRAQAPVLDGLMKELGLDGSSLHGLVAERARPAGERKEDPEPPVIPPPLPTGDNGNAEAAA